LFQPSIQVIYVFYIINIEYCIGIVIKIQYLLVFYGAKVTRGWSPWSAKPNYLSSRILSLIFFLLYGLPLLGTQQSVIA